MFEVSTGKSNNVLVGDLNIDFFKENNPQQSILNDYWLTYVVHGSTCFTNPDESTLNDVILINFPRRIASTPNISIGVHVSDHHNQIQAPTKMYAPKNEKRIIHYRTYKNVNESHFLDEWQHTPFQVVKIFADPDDQFWFHNKLCEKCYRLKYSKKGAFMKEQLKKAINVKGMLKGIFLQFKKQENIQNNLFTTLKRKSIRWYLNEHCKKNYGDDVKQTRIFWNTAR